MKVAVTGASGFIGRHVLADLARRDAEVVAVTRDADRLDGVKGGNVRIVELDIAEPPRDCFDRLQRPDVLLHLAWGGLPNYMSLHHFEVELPRHYRFLKNLVASGLAAMTVTGTCFEYGMQSGPLSEDAPALPANPYGFAKDVLRRQLEFLRDALPFSFTWARLFFMYGQGQGENSLLPQLQRAAAAGERQFNMSGGEQLRDFLPVIEVARCLAALCLQGADAGVVNVCAGKPVSVRSLVEGWIDGNGWDISLNLGYYPYPAHEPMAFWGNRRKLECLIGAG